MPLTPVYITLSPGQARYFADNPEVVIMAKDDRGFLLIGNWYDTNPTHPDDIGGIYLTPDGHEWYGGCEPGSSDYEPQVKLAAYVAEHPELLV